MTKQNFQQGDKIGGYTIDEFGGTNTKGEPTWWVVDESGKPVIIKESKLLRELRTAELTPQMVRNLSSKAYDQLRQEIGDDGIDEIMKSSKPQAAVQAPTATQQREISAKWFEAHPQIPQTRENSRLFNTYLGTMTNPSFSSRDFDIAFADLFFQLELHPKAAGIQRHGEAIRGQAAIDKLTASECQQLQKAFPVAVSVDYTKMSQDEILNEAARHLTADKFIDWTKEVDKEAGIAQPVPPLLLSDRERIWSTFFQVHANLLATSELQAKLSDLLKKHSEFNPSEQDFPILNQHLDAALQFLADAKDPVVQEGELARRTFGGTSVVMNDPRPRSPRIQDETPIVVTPAEINAMSGEEYGRRTLDPRFRAAVERLTKGVGIS
jgi:hypothetical protein